MIRKIYEEYLQFDIKPEVLAYLLALDALTIVAGAIYQSKLDPVYSLAPAIWRDAMLLEQQLPLFILEAAIDSLAIPPDREDLSELLDPPTPTSTPEYRSLYRTVVEHDPPARSTRVPPFTFVGHDPSAAHPTEHSGEDVRDDLSPDYTSIFNKASRRAAQDDPSPRYTEIFSRVAPTSSPVYMRAVVKFYGVTAFLYPFQSRAKMWKWQDPSNHEQSMLSHIYHTLELHVAEAAVKIKYKMPRITAHGATGNGDHDSGGMFLSCCAGAQSKQQTRPSETWSDELLGRLPTASKLRRCGIHFRAGDGGFTGIKFDATERVVTLPEITVFDTTKTYLLNLVAQEVLSSNLQEWPVTSYTALMDALIDTEEDVKILVDANVIRNVLGSHEELAKMWNSLAVNLPIRYTSDDRKVIGEVSEASRQCFRKCWAGFRDTYYDQKPWLFISIVAASCLFLLALLQTTYTILQYNNRSR